jgi:predicted ester cyclase
MLAVVSLWRRLTSERGGEVMSGDTNVEDVQRALQVPTVTTTVEHTLPVDDRVAVFRIARGTIRKDLDAFGIRSNGQEVTFRVSDNFALRNGKIAGHWEVADTAPLVQLAASEMR